MLEKTGPDPPVSSRTVCEAAAASQTVAQMSSVQGGGQG